MGNGVIGFANSVSFYFLMPIYSAFALLFIFFNLPDDFYSSAFSFLVLLTVPVFWGSILLPSRIKLLENYALIKNKPHYDFVLISVCFSIILFGPIDVYVNGFKLLDPASYADIYGIGRVIRHITTLSWILIPVAFLFIKKPLIKLGFIIYAILFPIIIIDRNRFFHSCYVLFLCLLLASPQPSKGNSNRLFMFATVVTVLVIFALIGKFRSGGAFVVESSATSLIEGAYPLSTVFFRLPAFLQQIVLYITSPIFNFLTVLSYDFINQDFLLKQFSPFGREIFAFYPYAPIFIPRFNVGTEFFPFLLYGRLPLVTVAVILLLLCFKLTILLFNKRPNIFTFLIFLRISYVVLFMGFAPQFYILLNLVFVVLMGLLWFFANLLESFFLQKNYANDWAMSEQKLS